MERAPRCPGLLPVTAPGRAGLFYRDGAQAEVRHAHTLSHLETLYWSTVSRPVDCMGYLGRGAGNVSVTKSSNHSQAGKACWPMGIHMLFKKGQDVGNQPQPTEGQSCPAGRDGETQIMTKAGRPDGAPSTCEGWERTSNEATLFMVTQVPPK